MIWKGIFISYLLIQLVSTITYNCTSYVMELKDLYTTNKLLFYQSMAPYMLYSGRVPDDLGFPSECGQDPMLKYYTAQIQLEYNNASYLTYYGLCFSSQCTLVDLNSYGAFIINAIMDTNIFQQDQVSFRQPNFYIEMNPGAIVIYCIFGGSILLCLIWSIIRWIKQCRQPIVYGEQQASTYQKINQTIHEDEKQASIMSVMQKLSLQARWNNCSQQQQSFKIMQFSLFKLIAVPILIFGELFYLDNFAAVNYFSFRTQIYQTLYSRVATFAYYIPDIFFFISGFLFSRKLFSLDQYKDQKFKFLGKAILKKFLRLYPLYIMTIFIFWFISPTLHFGPVWYVYQKQTEVCNYAWWRAFIFIDNWFTDGCYTPAWFVQVQFQLLLVCSIFFILYFFRRVIAIISLTVLLIATWAFLFIFSASLPISTQIVTDSFSQLYFRSTYSHAPFYLSGVILALLSQKQSVRSTIVTYFIQKISFLTIANLLALGLIIFVFLRPSVWQSALGLELGLCRFGVFIGFILLFIPGMFANDMHKTYIHKISYYTYPVILMSGIVTLSGFWCYETFPYVSGINLLNSTISTLFITIGVGILLGLIYDLRTFKLK